MKSRGVLAVLAVIGIMALTATAAQASGGGSPFPIKSFFVCHGVNPSPPPEGTVVEVESSLFGYVAQKVKIGNGVLACVIAKLLNSEGDEITPQPTPTENPNQEGLQCYTMSALSKEPVTPGVPDSYTVYDNLSDETAPDVVEPTNNPQYICAPANFIFNTP